MKLKRFNQKTTASAPRGRATIRFNKSGAISISGVAVDLTGINSGDYIEIVQDEQNPEDWYITKSDMNVGFKLRPGGKSGNSMANSAATCRAFLKQFPRTGKTSTGCLIGTVPVTFEGVDYWPIITSSAH